MFDTILPILALLPVAAVGVLLVGLRWPASRAMPVCYVLCALLSVLCWKTPPTLVAAATAKGAIIAGELLFIVFAAVLLLNTLEQCGAMESIRWRASCSIRCWRPRSSSNAGEGPSTLFGPTAPWAIGLRPQKRFSQLRSLRLRLSKRSWLGLR